MPAIQARPRHNQTTSTQTWATEQKTVSALLHMQAITYSLSIIALCFSPVLSLTLIAICDLTCPIMHRTHPRAGGEYNAHLTERFGNTAPRTQRNVHVPDDNIPEAVPSRKNDDIRKYYELANKPVAGAGAWLDKPEIPHPAEILRDGPSFATEVLIKNDDEPRPKKIDGPYDNTEDYLSTEYNLLREDALRPLREAVAEVRKDAWKDEAQYDKGVGIYDPVYITSLVFSTRGLATRVAFSMSRVKKLVR